MKNNLLVRYGGQLYVLICLNMDMYYILSIALCVCVSQKILQIDWDHFLNNNKKFPSSAILIKNCILEMITQHIIQ